MRLWQGIGILLITAAGAGLLAYMYLYGPQLAEQKVTSDDSDKVSKKPTTTQRLQVATPGKTIRLGWTAWADAEVVTTMAERLLEQRLGYQVERVMTDIGIQYQAVANGDLDIMLMAWLPLTHRNYWEKVRGSVVNLGPIYMGRLGWVVPDYIPVGEVASIGDLKKPKVARKIAKQVQGIDPGSGLMQASEQAMQRYDLNNLKLISASGAAMTAVLDRAYRQKQWVVVTAWQPHWIFARYKLRFLDDPQHVMGGDERIHAIARKGFSQDFPVEVTEFFTRLYLPADELAAILLEAQKGNVDDAVSKYIVSHPQRVRYWLTGQINEQ